MTALIFEEIKRIGEWKPYRPDWPVDRNLPYNEDGQQERYGQLINSFSKNLKFESIQYQDGGMSNFIEFVCFSPNSHGLNLEAIDVFINLCAPIGTYTQVSFFRQNDSHGLNHPAAHDLGNIKSENLKEIEGEVRKILLDNDITILSSEFLDRDLLPGLVIKENLIEGQKMFNYLFQWTD